jgi:hypothetical protein
VEQRTSGFGNEATLDSRVRRTFRRRLSINKRPFEYQQKIEAAFFAAGMMPSAKSRFGRSNAQRRLPRRTPFVLIFRDENAQHPSTIAMSGVRATSDEPVA